MMRRALCWCLLVLEDDRVIRAGGDEEALKGVVGDGGSCMRF